MTSIFGCTVLGGWLLLSILSQTPAFKRIRRWDRFGIIPRWYLFTHPATTWTCRLYVRHDAAGDWTHVPLWRSRRFGLLWDPQRRIGQAFLETVMQLTDLRLQGRREYAHELRAYQTLLHYVSGLQPDRHSVQFCIRITRPEAPDQPESVLFISNWHTA